jgi:Ca2+-binding EF-hand superfamily protein
MPAMPKMDPNAMFNRLDTNRDGMISRDEFAKGHEMRIERRVEMKGPDGQAMKMRHPDMDGMRGMHGGGMGGMMGARLFTMADTNKDGRVTLPEAQAAAAQHFAMADTNRDGRVTADEMKAMHAKMGAMNHAG